MKGASKLREYSVWNNIKSRCYNKSCKEYKNYGGRGIIISDSWRNDFSQFYKDMGPRPSSKHTIERINNNGNYCKENCKWATYTDQANNTRKNRFLFHDNKRLTVAQWSDLLGIPRVTIHARLRAGWPIEHVLSTFRFIGGKNVKSRTRLSYIHYFHLQQWKLERDLNHK